MIGSNRLPPTLTKIARLFRSGAAEDWRKPWDFLDRNIEEALFAVAEAEGFDRPDIYSFRSNQASISILGDGTKWSVAFDERFFDYLLTALLPFGANIPRTEAFKANLLAYAAEVSAVEDPYFASSLLRLKARLFGGAPGVAVRFAPGRLANLKAIYRIARIFVLAHEIGHIAMCTQAIRARETGNLEFVVHSTLDLAGRYSGEASSRAEAYKSLAHLLKQEMSDPNSSEEFLADVFAVRTTMDVWISISKVAVERELSEHSLVKLCHEVYEALRLIFLTSYVLALTKDFFRYKAAAYDFGPCTDPTVIQLVARQEVRGRLWQIYFAQQMNFDPEALLRSSATRINEISTRFSQVIDSDMQAFFPEQRGAKFLTMPIICGRIFPERMPRRMSLRPLATRESFLGHGALPDVSIRQS